MDGTAATRRRLGSAILAAFKLARAVKDEQVAEHLLCALEALTADDVEADSLAQAYLDVSTADVRRH